MTISPTECLYHKNVFRTLRQLEPHRARGVVVEAVPRVAADSAHVDAGEGAAGEPGPHSAVDLHGLLPRADERPQRARRGRDDCRVGLHTLDGRLVTEAADGLAQVLEARLELLHGA